MRAAVSTDELAQAVGPVDGVEIIVWNGDGPAPEGIEFWVPHYATRPDVIDRGHELVGLEVVQLQSAGYDGVAERLPPGITLCNATGVHDDATAEHGISYGRLVEQFAGRAGRQGAWAFDLVMYELDAG